MHHDFNPPPPPPPPPPPFFLRRGTPLPLVVCFHYLGPARLSISQLQQERIWTRVLEKVFEGDGMGEEVPGYGSEMRLEDHCISAEGVSLFSVRDAMYKRKPSSTIYPLNVLSELYLVLEGEERIENTIYKLFSLRYFWCGRGRENRQEPSTTCCMPKPFLEMN